MTNSNHSPLFPHKVAIIQRLLPTYRVPFFEELAKACSSLEIFAGTPGSWEGIRTTTQLQQAQLKPAQNIHIARGKFYFCWQQGLFAWLRQVRSDILVMEANPRLLSNYLGVWLMRKWKRPVVGWGLGVLDWKAPRWILILRRLVLQMFYSQFDVLITYSSKGAHNFQQLGIAKEKIFIAHNAVAGINTEEALKTINQNPGQITKWKRKWEISEKLIVLFVGRLIPEKEVCNLIEACSELSDRCELVIVGEGPERSNLEALAMRSPAKVRFLGHQTGEELSLCFAAADLFVLPGLGGLAIQEAMGYGKPVIVAIGDGTQADLVREGKNGFLVKPKDVSSLSQAIKKSISDQDFLIQMGQESLRIVREEHNLGAMKNAFINALAYAIQQKK